MKAGHWIQGEFEKTGEIQSISALKTITIILNSGWRGGITTA